MDAHDPLAVARGLDEMVFHELASFDRGMLGVFRASGSGAGPWEMHPENEEMLQVLDGTVTIDVLTEDGEVSTPLATGSVMVVPRGHWHRHRDAEGLVEMFLTPGPSEQSSADDPRTA